jgi:hypothetical protein
MPVFSHRLSTTAKDFETRMIGSSDTADSTAPASPPKVIVSPSKSVAANSVCPDFASTSSRSALMAKGAAPTMIRNAVAWMWMNRIRTLSFAGSVPRNAA